MFPYVDAGLWLKLPQPVLNRMFDLGFDLTAYGGNPNQFKSALDWCLSFRVPSSHVNHIFKHLHQKAHQDDSSPQDVSMWERWEQMTTSKGLDWNHAAAQKWMYCSSSS